MRKSILAAALLALALPLCVSAQGVPRTMSYQGYLTDAAGQPVADGTYKLTFTLYTGEFAGSSVWTETQGSVQVTRGLFAVVLGESQPLNASFDTQYWLGVKVGDGTELLPRVKLATSAYSHRAREADGIAVGTITNAHVAAGAGISTSKLAPEVLTQGEISAGTGIGVQAAGDNVVISTSNVPAAAILPDVLSSVNGVSNDGGNIDLVAGANVTITPNPSTKSVTIAASGGGGGFTLPITATANTVIPAFIIENGGSGTAAAFINSSSVAGISAVSIAMPNATGASHALLVDAKTGNAILANNMSGTSGKAAIEAENTGGGKAIRAESAGDGTADATILAMNTNTSSDAKIYSAWATGMAEVFYVRRSGDVTATGTVKADKFMATTNLGSGTPETGIVYKDNICQAWAVVDGSGTTVASFGCSVVPDMALAFRVTLDVPFSNTNYAVFATPNNTGAGDELFCWVRSKTAGTFVVHVDDPDGTVNIANDGFAVVVFGRR